MPDKIDEAPHRLMIGGKRVLLKYAPNQKSACQNCVFHTDDIEHCSLRETDYFGIICPCERFGNFSSYPYFVLDNNNIKEFTIPDRIYIYSNAGGNSYSVSPTENVTDKKFEIEYLRADKVMEILDSYINNKERFPESLCGEFQTYHDALVYTYRQGVEAALEALRPQPRWKPSEEQMKALWEVYSGGEKQAALASLFNDLKKL